MRPLLLLMVAVAVQQCMASSVSFELEAPATRCLRTEVHKDVLVVHQYTLSPSSVVKIKIHITDSKGHTVYRKALSQETGKFAYTPDDFDTYELCFSAEIDANGGAGSAIREVSFKTVEGVEARDYKELAAVDKLKPLEAEMRRLEDLSTSIVASFTYMQKREEQLRETNDSTNTMVFYFTLFSMGCLLALAFWQVYYLKRFFQAKKLI